VGPVALAVGGGAVRLLVAGAGEALDISGDIENLPLALASLAEPGLDLAGTVSGKLRLAGAAPLPAIDVALTATGVRPADVAKESFDGLTIEATLRQDGSASRMVLKLRGPDDATAEGSLQAPPIVGLAPLRLLDVERHAISGKIDAKARLGAIERIVALGDDRLAGQLAANVTIGGTLARPVVKGAAILANGAYEGATTGVVLRDARARIDFTGDGARLVSLAATDGAGGRLAGSGTFAFRPGTSGADRMTVKLERFIALRRREAEIVASGAVTLEGALTSPAVRGRLTVERGELRIPDRLPEEVVDLDVEEINLPDAAHALPRPAEKSASRSLPVALDLAIDFPGKTFVRGRGLDSEWKGALTVKGPSANPAIVGKLGVVRGTFDFAGKVFVLKSGSVAFSGSDSAEPEIDATAEARLKMLLARIRIGGRLSRPSISVESEPPMPQEEVLAHILFGRTTGQLSAIQAAQLAQTAATLSGNAGGANIVDRVRQALGVDVLNVETGEAGAGASLKAGKYITEDVFLSVTQGTEPGSQKVGVEVEVLPNLSLESDIGGPTSGNVGVNWKFDY
jgi:translocation and assembly module TamB